jgi:hypothetical protein
MIALATQGERDRIGRLTVRASAPSAGARLALAAAFDRTELRPTGFPPSAVLIVRHMDDPLPRRLAAQPHPGGPGADWERAARDSIANFYRNAARPSRGTVGADATAVLFADEAELLAALAFDLATGRIGEQWWWRSYRRTLRQEPSALATLLNHRAVWVPAALAELARQDRAGVVVSALQRNEALAVLRVVAAEHGMPAIGALLSPPQSFAGASADRDEPPAWAGRTDKYAPASRSAGARRTRALPGEVAGRNSAVPPWEPVLSAGFVPPTLGAAKAALLGVALVLHRRREVGRSTAFSMALRRWWQVTDPPRATPPAPPERKAVLVPSPQAVAPASQSGVADLPKKPQAAQPGIGKPKQPAASVPPADDRSTPDTPTRPPPVGASRPPSASVGPLTTRAGEMPHDADVLEPLLQAPPAAAVTVARDPAVPEIESAEVTGVITSEASEAPALSDSAAMYAATEAEWRLELEGGVETALGGILFLINAMCSLDLPECFEEGWRLASSVGAWGLLEGLARTLFDRAALLPNDPIWAALAMLSGRGRVRLGTGAPRGVSYHLPESWAAQLPSDDSAPAAWAARHNRLRLWSRGGFMLSDEPASGDGSADGPYPQARRQARRPFGDAPLAIVDDAIASGFRRWLSFAVPFLRVRLERALRLDPAETVSRALLRRRGQLYVTATHVDLVMSLDQVSLPARKAGLDRSPGWLGAFGRVVLFHFE